MNPKSKSRAPKLLLALTVLATIYCFFMTLNGMLVMLAPCALCAYASVILIGELK